METLEFETLSMLCWKPYSFHSFKNIYFSSISSGKEKSQQCPHTGFAVHMHE